MIRRIQKRQSRRLSFSFPRVPLRLVRRAALLLVPLVFLAVSKFIPSPGYENITVTKVYDGDTIKIVTGEHVRLLGIDTPELHESDKLYRDAYKTRRNIAAIQAQGQKAYEFTRDLVAGRRVRLEFDAQRQDKYGRLLAYVYTREDVTGKTISFSPIDGVVYLVKQDDRQYVETFVNAMIVAEGYAQLMTIRPNTLHTELFEKLYQAALKDHRGLWR